MATALIGTILGSFIVGKPADTYGRRTMLFVIGLTYFVSAVGSAFAWSWISFALFRFLGGLAAGRGGGTEGEYDENQGKKTHVHSPVSN